MIEILNKPIFKSKRYTCTLGNLIQIIFIICIGEITWFIFVDYESWIHHALAMLVILGSGFCIGILINIVCDIKKKRK